VLGGVVGFLDVFEMCVDECMDIEECVHVLFSVDLFGVFIFVCRFQCGERLVAGAKFEFCLVKEGSCDLVFVFE